MLHRGNKKFVFLIIGLILISCNSKKEREIEVFNLMEIEEIRNTSLQESQNIVGKDDYWNVYNKMVDSVNLWIKEDLGNYEHFNRIGDFCIDSVFSVNKKGNKLIAIIINRSLISGSTLDYLDYQYGVKIDNNWFFFKGPRLVLPREYYQEDIHIPLSFEKLKQIAAKEIYQSYLIKNSNGEWGINDAFFNDLTSGAWCSNCSTQIQWDSAYMNQVYLNWSRKAVD
jgi:hypothetical protein